MSRKLISHYKEVAKTNGLDLENTRVIFAPEMAAMPTPQEKHSHVVSFTVTAKQELMGETDQSFVTLCEHESQVFGNEKLRSLADAVFRKVARKDAQ